MVEGLCVTRVHLGAAVVLRPVGEFDLASVEILRESLLSSIACMPCVVLDLSETGFLDSVCLGALVAGRKKALAAGGWVRLVQPSGAVHRILRLTNLDALFGVYATVDDALSGDLANPEAGQPSPLLPRGSRAGAGPAGAASELDSGPSGLCRMRDHDTSPGPL